MSDKEALYNFTRKPVNSEMVHYLVDTTYSVIKVKQQSTYPSPPTSPACDTSVSLYEFIRRLIKHSNVQTPTLMSTLVYLERLRSILPPNVYGIETTRHRIFLGCLILAAKSLNDSSPINKHWAHYTDGLLSIAEVNTIERELLEYLHWDLSITQRDLINSFAYFLTPIKQSMNKQQEEKLLQRQKHYICSSASSRQLSSLINNKKVVYSASNSSVPSLLSASSSRSTLSSINTLSSNSLNNVLREPATTLDSYQSPAVLPKKSSSSKAPLRMRTPSDNNQQPQMRKSSKSTVSEAKSKFSLLSAGRLTRAF